MALSVKSIRSVMPLLDRVLVQRMQPQQKTASGIFLPSSESHKALPEAQVIAVGPGAKDKDGKIMDMSVKAGDKVLLPSFGGQPIKVGDEEYTLFRDAEILAKLSE